MDERTRTLLEMPEDDRKDALFDEFVYGVFYAEETEDGPRRIDPTDVVIEHP